MKQMLPSIMGKKQKSGTSLKPILVPVEWRETHMSQFPCLSVFAKLKTVIFLFVSVHTLSMDSVTLLCTGGVLVCSASLYWFIFVYRPVQNKGLRAVDLSGGSISSEKVRDKYKQYWSFFLHPKEIEKTDKVPDFVDTFYNLVTDIYEWGWGQSFHFSPAVDGKFGTDARRHELMAAELVDLKPGNHVIDVGCGIGGPMRTIAAHMNSSVKITGITINEYQVNRAKILNKNAGLDGVCDVVCANFLDMPFPDNTFDRAYSIESTCHAPKLEEVYSEIFRVLKPGALYVSYEWATTEKYKSENPEHVDIIHGIEIGDALPGLRTQLDLIETAKKVGFEVVKDMDLAQSPSLPWWTRLKMRRMTYWRNHVLITILAAFGLTPKGTVDVHDMLCKTARYLTRGGETGIFTPMHMILCIKPIASQD